MYAEYQRVKSLIIGCDFPTLHTYVRSLSHRTDIEVCGFVFCYSEPLPITIFSPTTKTQLPIYQLKDLENSILDNKVTKCIIQIDGLPMPKVNGILHRINSTGRCGIEFVSPNQSLISSHKPTLIISSISSSVEKTQITRYLCDVLFKGKMKVAVIIPIVRIGKAFDIEFSLKTGPHYEYGMKDSVPGGLFPDKIRAKIIKFQKSGAYSIFVTSDIRKAVILSEQAADIILIDSPGANVTQVVKTAKFCVVTRETIKKIRRTSNWPGLFNVFDCDNIVYWDTDGVLPSNEEIVNLRTQLTSKSTTASRNFFNVLAKTRESVIAKQNAMLGSIKTNTPVKTEEDSPGKSTIQRSEPPQKPTTNPQSKPIPDGITPFFTAGLEGSSAPEHIPQDLIRISSPLTADAVMISKEFNDNFKLMQNGMYITLNLPFDIKGLNPEKHILDTTREIDDQNNSILEWVTKTFFSSRKPPLQKHFEAQVDMLTSMLNASASELNVTNNDSSNRETFTRLFLQSHIPPGFHAITGEIVDCHSNRTGELGVIITNDDSPSLTMDVSGSVITPVIADSVLGVVEVKSQLTVEALKKGLSQLRPVKALMPMHDRIQTPDGRIIADPLGGKIVTGVFAFAAAGDIESRVGETLNLYPSVADFIVIPGSFSFFRAETLQVCGIDTPTEGLINGYVKYTPKGMGLALMFGMLNSLAAIRQFSGSNYISYLSGSWETQQEAFKRISEDFGHTLRNMHTKLDRANIGTEGDRQSLSSAENDFKGVAEMVSSERFNMNVVKQKKQKIEKERSESKDD